MMRVTQCDDRPRLDLGRGRYLRHVIDNTYEQISFDGRHIRYFTSIHIVYEPTLDRQFIKQRTTRT